MNADRDRQIAIVSEEQIRLLMKQGRGVATRMDAARKQHDLQCERFGKDFEETKNPIWVWRCLVVARHIALLTARSCPEARTMIFVGPLPDWCLRYFLETAFTIDGMMERVRLGYLDAADAATGLPSALGFTRQGKNAFDRYKGEYLHRLAADLALCEQEERGLTNADTLKRFMDHALLQDERSARRTWNRMTAGRRVKPGG